MTQFHHCNFKSTHRSRFTPSFVPSLIINVIIAVLQCKFWWMSIIFSSMQFLGRIITTNTNHFNSFVAVSMQHIMCRREAVSNSNLQDLITRTLLWVQNYNNMQNVTLIIFALHKGLTYFKICIFKFFHKVLNILTVRCKYSVNTLSPHYLRNSYYNLKKEKKNVTMS